MKKKSVAIVVWVISAVIAVAVGLVALSQDCIHSWNVTAEVSATCYSEGKTTYECLRCRETKTESTPKIAHNFSYNWTTTLQPTCTTDGLKIRTCTNNGCTERETERISRTGHDYVEVSRIEATCTAAGEKFLECRNGCGADKTEPIPMKAHTWKDVPTNAMLENETYVPIDPTVVACFTALYNDHQECEICKTKSENYVEYAPGHFTEEGWIIELKPTCSTEGRAVQSCQVEGCPNFGEVKYQNLPKLDHEWTWVDAKGSTCMESGYNRHQKCEACGETKGYATVEKKNHVFNDEGYCTLGYDCGTYTYEFTENADGNYTLTSINKNSLSDDRTEFNIPALYNGKPVTAIADGVFNGFTSIRKITITQNILSIGKSAFKNCTNLQSVTVVAGEQRTALVSNVVKVGDYAFEGCTKLKEFDFTSLKEIGEAAFYGTAFEEIILTDSVTSIGASAFGATSKLASITVPYVGMTKNDGYVFSIIFGTVPQSLKTVKVLSAEALVKDAFKAISSLESVVLPADCKEFGESAFDYCTSLTTVYVGEKANDFSNATALGANIFKKTKLTSLVLPFLGNGSNKTNLGYLYGGENGMVSAELTSVELPTVTVIADNAFAGCANIVTIKLGAIKTIGEYAFNGCEKLKNIITDNDYLTGVFLGENVTSLGLGAFAGCTSIESLTVPFLGVNVGAKDARNLGFFFGASDSESFNGIENLSLKSVTVLQCNADELLDAGAFKGFTSITSVRIPAVKAIGENAFAGCVALESVYYGTNENANDFVQVTVNGESKEIKTVESIGFAAFEGCFRNNKVVFKMVLPFIGETSETGEYTEEKNPYALSYIFGSATNAPRMLKEVEIKTEEEFAVSPYAFKNFEYLETVVLPETLTEIGKNAFENCKKLKNVSFEEADNLTRIYEYAFKGCSSLETIFVPNSVTCIEIAVFDGCTSLRKMTLPFVGRSIENATAIQQAFGYIFNAAASTTLQGEYVPKSLAEVVITGGTSLVKNAFNGCKYLKSVTLPVTLETIGEGVFKGCSALEKVIFDGAEGANADAWKLEEISKAAFSDCTSLQTVVLPKSVKSIGSGAFISCTSLQTIRTANSGNNTLCVTTIDQYAFKFAFNNATLVLKDVKEIQLEAFASCRLASIKLDAQEENGALTFGNHVFYNAEKLRTAILPNWFTKIGTAMFSGCKNLTNFTMPESIRYISDYAFMDCSKLTINATHADFEGKNALVFDHAVVIGERAFENCTSLKELVFINSDEFTTNTYDVMTIGVKAFNGCSGVTRVYLAAYNCGYGETYIEKGVAVIGESAFSGCGSIYNSVAFYTSEIVSYENGWHSQCFEGANVANLDKICFENVSYETYLSEYSLYGEKAA